jgi:hypothetical protein
MRRTYRFSRTSNTPLVVAKLLGKGKPINVRLVFDTGAALTQFSTRIIESLGYSARDGIQEAVVSGPTGALQSGYTLHMEELTVLGKKFSQPLVAAFDFDHLDSANIDGLLGFDLIKEFQLELNGPKGQLVVFD